MRKINKKKEQSPRLQEVFCEKGVLILRNFAKFIGKQLCQSLFFEKFQKGDSNTGAFLFNFVRNF